MFKNQLSKIRQSPAWLCIVMTLCLGAVLLRFASLDDSPPGFYIDEAAISAQVICLRQSGHDVFNRSWPLFTQVLGGGHTTPVYLYGGALWTSLFGDSIVAFRAFAAFFGAGTVLGVFLLASTLFRRREAAWLSALCAAISPWAFMHSRIAWDPPMAPFFIVWSLYFLFRKDTAARFWGSFAGLLAAAVFYSYPPTRVQGALFVVPAMIYLYKFHPENRGKIIPFSIAGILTLIPLVQVTLSGEILGRARMLSIFGDYYLSQHGGFSLSMIAQTFFSNLVSFFSPRFLVVSGDTNIRHSTQVFGQWSWVELLAIGSAVLYFLYNGLKHLRFLSPLALLLIIGYLAGLSGAALTWESNPHALRSIGAFPFLALLSGFVLQALIDQWKHMTWVITVLSLVFFSWFSFDFFSHFPERSRAWFDQEVQEKAFTVMKDLDPTALNEQERLMQMQRLEHEIRQVAPGYEDMAILYYKLHFGLTQCK